MERASVGDSAAFAGGSTGPFVVVAAHSRPLGEGMRAIAVMPEEKSLRLVDHPEPAIERDTEVKVRMLEVGICGTDREIARFDYGTAPPSSPYLIIGHESLAQVIETGAGVKRVKAGDLVVSTVRRPCPHGWCKACSAGRQDFCFTGDFTECGIKARHGFMTEWVVDDERFMHVVPGRLRDVGVLVEPLTIAEKALTQVWDVQARLPWTAPGASGRDGHGQKAVVLGAGPVGLLGALALLTRGFATWVCSREPATSAKADWVRSVGATYVSSESLPATALPELVGNIDLVYEATGAAKVSFEAMATLGVNGVFVFTGVPGRKDPIEVDANLLMRNLVLKNQLVFGTVNASGQAFDSAIADLAAFLDRWPGPLGTLVTGRYAPEEYSELLLGPPAGIKRVVRFSEAS